MHVKSRTCPRRAPLFGPLLVALLLCVSAVAAQFRQRIDLVTVDVTVVNDRGEPATNLTSSEFEVLVDGKPRAIVAFRRAGRDSGSTAEDATRVASGESAHGPAERTIVLVVQPDAIRPNEGRAFIDAAAAFIDTLDPADRVAVRTMPADSPELRIPRDRAAVKQELRAVRGTAPPPHPLLEVTPDEAVAIAHLRDPSTLSEVTIRECGRHANAGPACRQEVELEARRRYDEITVRAAHTLQQIDHLVRLLSGLAGPKHIVFITTGPPHTPENAEAVDRVAGAAARARVLIHALQIPDSTEGIDAEDRTRPGSRHRPNTSAGYSLATMSGGMAMTPSDPRVTFRRLSAELSAAYEIGIEPEPHDRDGRPHRIEVRVKRPNLSVRARRRFVLSPLPPRTVAPPEPPPSPVPDVPPVAAGDPVPAGVLTRLGDYVSRFEREFSSAVAEERYVQLIRPRTGSPAWPSDEEALEWHDGRDYPGSGVIVERRQLLSDVVLVHTPQGWVGYRDVAEVDGGAVRRRSERVSKLFLSRDADRDDQLRRIAQESARYNIGGFARTLNIPTLPLSFMRARNHSRFTFTSAGREQLDEHSTQVIRYEEHQRPTLIGDRAGNDVPISGRVWIDVQSGEVVQTEIRVTSGERRSLRRGTIVTRYRRDPLFNVLVPDYMWEWYDGNTANTIGSVIRRTIVEGLARYTNYRRFTVSTTEIPK